jgi:altronate hydrolase
MKERAMSDKPVGRGYARADGRIGIRNTIVVAYLVECARHVAQEGVLGCREHPVQLAGFRGCYPNDHAERVMHAISTHPNVGGVVLVSLGCEAFDRQRLQEAVRASDRPCETVVIQQTRGTEDSIRLVQSHIRSMHAYVEQTPLVPLGFGDLVVGTVCGGSDATSGISANPAVGRFFDRFIALGGTGIFEETGELVGCETIVGERGITPQAGEQAARAVTKAAGFYVALGHGSFAPGNAEGGLSTIEEKSLGAYAKSGSSPIQGVIYPGQQPQKPGLWLLDVVPDGEPMHGFPNISDVVEIIEMAACGAHLVLYTSGRGSVAGSAVAPTVKICGNPDTCARMSADIDIDAGAVITGAASLEDVAGDILRQVVAMANGTPSKPERLGHLEFDVLYKRFDIKDGFRRGRLCG